jgi:hypothetical protein
MHDLHWYTLIPRDGVPEEDERSIPAAPNQDEALFYFERNLTSHLEICTNEDSTAEYLLEKRLRSGVGPGELVDRFYVRREKPKKRKRLNGGALASFDVG